MCILYFVWEDQRDSAYCIFHTILIICITVLYTEWVGKNSGPRDPLAFRGSYTAFQYIVLHTVPVQVMWLMPFIVT